MWGKPLIEFKVPAYDEPGSFGYVRKFHTHEGVDLYAPDGTEVYAVEDGKVLGMPWFTGEPVGMPWWENTRCVIVEGATGIVVYGEMTVLAYNPDRDFEKEPYYVKKGDCVGVICRVLKKDKGRPMSMLHLELYEPGTKVSEICHPWAPNGPRPKGLLDPTKYLKEIEDGVQGAVPNVLK